MPLAQLQPSMSRPPLLAVPEPLAHNAGCQQCPNRQQRCQDANTGPARAGCRAAVIFGGRGPPPPCLPVFPVQVVQGLGGAGRQRGIHRSAVEIPAPAR